MIDNTMHRLLCEAADQAGWDEETMMLQATRFLDRLACEYPDMEQQFQHYLNEEVAFEVLADAEPGCSARSFTNCGESLAGASAEEDDDG